MKRASPYTEQFPPETVTPVQLWAAGGILDRLIAEPVADNGWQGAIGVSQWRILPILPPAVNHVVPLEHRKQTGNFLRIILKVGVESRDDLSARRFEPGIERRALAAVVRQPKHAQPGAIFHCFHATIGAFDPCFHHQ